jgi:hypothetical protein
VVDGAVLIEDKVAVVVFELLLLVVFKGGGGVLVPPALDSWDCDRSRREKDISEARKRQISLSNSDIAAITVNAPCVQWNNR